MEDNLQKKDSKIFNLIQKERERKETSLEMIPSENHTSQAVLEAMSTVLSDKYAEGYPGDRYYGGNQYIDQIESLAQQRAQKLFDVPKANVQPYSGSPANHAVYLAVLSPGDKVMGMDLKAGGHLTHGRKVNFSGTYYQPLFYGLNDTDQFIDYDQLFKLAEEEKPDLIWAGGSAYPRDFDWEKFEEASEIADAYLAADIAHVAGLIIAGAQNDPAPHADIITTTTHKTLRGPRGGMIMVTKKGLDKDPELGSKIDKAVFPGLQGGPHEHQIAAKAVCFKEALSDKFKEYGKRVIKNNKVLAQELKSKGFDLVTGGSDNHLCLIDLRNRDLDGQKAEELLETAGITTNKNTVPSDTSSLKNPSGLRLGTPAITTRGLRKEDIKQVVEVIDKILSSGTKEVAKKSQSQIKKITEKYPL